jgi:hypothetical protein
MMPKTPRVKHRATVKLIDSKGRVLQENEDASTYLQSYGAYLRVPVPKKVGLPTTYTVMVEYLGEHQYKQTYQQRVKALAASEKRREKWQKEQERLQLEKDERELVQRRKRIVNQVELAFVKKGKEAVEFITCDKCDAAATHLGLTHLNPGSRVIDPDQITGAWCELHDYPGARPFKTKDKIACNRLEFFYDGLRQIYVKEAAAA